MDANRLLEIANELGFENVVSELQPICERSNTEECTLLLPLVGLFSAGKTTLLNALTESNALETGIEPTTATIYELHFGCDHSYAKIYYPNGTSQDIDDIATLNNKQLSNATVVNIYDTSKKVPKSIILVDTPGLSSPDIKHKQVLMDFVPNADGVLLVMDVNQQLTKALSDFVKDVSLTNRPVYMVLTYCDTKTEEDVALAKKNIIDSAIVPFQDIVTVSAKTGDIQQLYNLFNDIQKNKLDIIRNADASRIKIIASKLISMIDALLQVRKEDTESERLENLERELNQINRKVDKLLDDTLGDIEKAEKEAIRTFEDIMYEKLDSIAANRSTNHDVEAQSAIGSTSSMVCSNFQQNVRKTLLNAITSGNDVELTEIDTSWMQLDDLSYNLNLGEMGHQYDSIIASGIKIAATVGAAAVGASSAGAGGMFDAADTVSDVLYDGDSVGSQLMKSSGNSSGLASIVGLVTDQTMGKPQRRRAIHNYLDGELMPQFSQAIQAMSEKARNDFRQQVIHNTSEKTRNLKVAIETLENERKINAEAYNERMNTLKELKKEITNNY